MPSFSSRCTLALAATLAGLASAAAAEIKADDAQLARLAVCADSWYEWNQQEPQRMRGFAQAFQARFTQVPKEPAFDPKAPLTVLGLPVLQAFPGSVGMGLGFSLSVRAGFAEARQAMEKQLGRAMQCERSDGAMACELKLGEKKTAMLIAPLQANDRQPTLLGCYYFYQP
ncbi:hypothetical protein [Paucibacter sp. M5-1]|uniref:hypothetical protein n=1 Tax=Paucibacter sp. M5-1 TaxID=3015998 RepID=UPI0022B8983B|nr:hypothetical protein [Paucibacter sp. M5-1]MCZ7880946.1 hypothetical protein [Paucibacter sp. M5-1]